MEDDKNILKLFIKEFLPPTRERRKNSGNELSEITKVLNIVFKKYFEINCSREVVDEAFSALGNYSFFNRQLHDDKLGTREVVYVDVKASSVNNLEKLRAKLPQNTKSKKIAELAELVKRVEEFKVRYLKA